MPTRNVTISPFESLCARSGLHDIDQRNVTSSTYLAFFVGGFEASFNFVEFVLDGSFLSANDFIIVKDRNLLYSI